jgi:hypothetical protein
MSKDTIHLYSVQRTKHWYDAKRLGYLSAGDGSGGEQDWRAAYRWMVGQMRARLPAFSGDHPVWAFLYRPYIYDPEGPIDREYVLLEFEIPRERVLLSDFSAWHWVMSQSFLSMSDEEFDATDPRGSTPPDATTVERSWHRIFEPDTITEWVRGDDRRLQACVDRVYLHEVRSVRAFREKQDSLDQDDGHDDELKEDEQQVA